MCGTETNVFSQTAGKNAVDASRKHGADGASLQAAGKVAVAAALAATLSGGPINAEAFELPQPVPIVYVLQPPAPDAPVLPADDAAPDSKPNFWQRLLQILKWVLVAILLVGTCTLGVMKGCSTVAVVPPPLTDTESE